MSSGVGSQLRAAIYCKLWHSQVTDLQAGDQQVGEPPQEPPSYPQEEWCGCMPQEFAGFVDTKRGHMPEIEMLDHRLGEHRLWPETRQSRMIDSFFLRVH